MIELILLVVTVLAVVYGLYARRVCREAERRLRTVTEDWLRLAERVEQVESELAEARAEAKAQAESGYREYEALAKATGMTR